MSLRKPPLYQAHLDAGAEFTDFGGWEMPVKYDTISTEHAAVRDSVGIFDVSHMSEVKVSGTDATELMNRLTSNDVRDLDRGDAQYSCILNEDGIIIDDTVVYSYPDENAYLFVPNAGHGEQMVDRWSKYSRQLGLQVSVENKTEEMGLVAVQGPDAIEIVENRSRDSITDLGRFSMAQTAIEGVECLIARTGYTGEDGVEIFFDTTDSEEMWKSFSDVPACGLGARDTLRLEAGLLLSGQDFDPKSEPRTPLEAKLSFVVDLSKPRFVGQDALKALEENGVEEKLVGLHLNERGIPRNGYEVTDEGESIGHVTSGTMSPTLNEPIALAYVDSDKADENQSVEVQIRGRAVPATIVNHRFLSSLTNDNE
ncbi:aminomethyltransferase [Halogranum amylolyticum]|uniref:Probable aminomethyltransferase n=1 Tax=Halogranum amylolyticum TaxID=660520 RepID=A0A1H8UD30_9EURY|nr:glycine cleavage system aminomethyltransferase GcvT [Halogranum amylolyticum]SEP01081.1 aminomethyltransferase [Halogranum amylolyticum]